MDSSEKTAAEPGVEEARAAAAGSPEPTESAEAAATEPAAAPEPAGSPEPDDEGADFAIPANLADLPPEQLRQWRDEFVQTYGEGKYSPEELQAELFHILDRLAQVKDELAAAKLAEAKDLALRAHAEAQNTRRRAEQDAEKARKFALERFAGELLPVVDNLERACDAAADATEAEGAGAAGQPIAEGVALTLKSLLDAMARFNIECVNPAGAPFDPALHEAMTQIPNPDAPPNTVIEVMQKGYTLSGRLLRPARVVVSKAAPAAAAPAAAENDSSGGA